MDSRVDLFQIDPNSLTDSLLYEAVRQFTGVERSFEERPQESTRLDFKQEWNDKALQSVAALANTFGGLVIVGISDDKGRAGSIVGIKADTEQATRIASSIATNISPTPPIQIGECSLPGEIHKSICVIRVLASNDLHYLLKGDKPVYWRNQDQSIPADATQLRALIAQRVIGSTIPSTTSSRLQSAKNLVPFPTGNPAIMAVYLAPKMALHLHLDAEWEQSFRQLLQSTFVEESGNIREGEASWKEERHRDWYLCRWTGIQSSIHRSWCITDSGEYAFISTLQGTGTEQQYWSVADAAVGLVLSLKHIGDFWSLCGYYGEAECEVLITNVGKSQLRCSQNEYPVGYRNLAYRYWDSLSKDIIRSSGSSSDIGAASLTLTFGSLTEDLDATCASLLNQILRCLNYLVDVPALTREIAHVMNKLNTWKQKPQIQNRLKLRINKDSGQP